MKSTFTTSRHWLSFLTFGLLVFGGTVQANEQTQYALPVVKMKKDPYCGCCDLWADHMRSAGFTVDVEISNDMSQIKRQHGITDNLASCHTAVIDGYVIEGHVPAQSVKKLISQKPTAKGLTVPGMPIGSPGMEVDGQTADTYDVLLFKDGFAQRYDRYHGGNRL